LRGNVLNSLESSLVIIIFFSVFTFKRSCYDETFYYLTWICKQTKHPCC
jgi:hypothetical protein